MVRARIHPDTNVALHYRPFGEIDWCALSAADEVELVINIVFLREIDHHKNYARGTLQKRARRISSWLGTLRRGTSPDIRDGVRVVVETGDPEAVCDLASFGLVPTVNDDKFIACVLRDRIACPGMTLICVTADNALAYKAEGQGIRVLEPPEECKLPDEPDEAQVELRALKKQLAELAARTPMLPELNVRFTGGAGHTGITIDALSPMSTDLIEQHVRAERALLEFAPKVLGVMFDPPPETKIRAYQEEFRSYLEEHNRRAVMSGLTFAITLVLENIGPGNADDNDVDLTFPNDVHVALRRPLPAVRQPPEPPQMRDRFNPMSAIMEPLRAAAIGPFVKARSLLDVEFRGPSIEIVSPHRIRMNVGALKHQNTCRLPDFQAWYENGTGLPEGFALTYRIHSASTSEIRTGSLHVRLEIRRGIVRRPIREDLSEVEPAGEDDLEGDS